MSGRWQRLYRGETTINFYGRRNVGFIASGLLLLVTIVSLFAQGLNLGIDFKGGVAFEMSVNGKITVEEARSILEENKVEASGAKIQTLSSGADERIRIQLEVLEPKVEESVREDLATKVGIKAGDVSIEKVSATWGRGITRDAIQALLTFLVLVSLFIAWRFEARMAAGALAAVVHDVLISVGVYSVTGLEVTPATVVAFLTILGFSLYDTIVVFDKVKDNIEKFGPSRTSMADITNVSMNQVLMRSLNTSLAAVLPVLSLLVLGSGVLGAIALREFAIALLVGLITGSYSSIYIASPLLSIFKQRESRYKNLKGAHATGAELAHMVISGGAAGAKSVRRQTADSVDSATVPHSSPSSTALLTHPPRPRKKRRR
jgi:preprotein translocase subunit SecF